MSFNKSPEGLMPDCSATFGVARETAPVQPTEPAEPVRVNLFQLSPNQFAWMREQGTLARQEVLTDISEQLGGIIELRHAQGEALLDTKIGLIQDELERAGAKARATEETPNPEFVAKLREDLTRITMNRRIQLQYYLAGISGAIGPQNEAESILLEEMAREAEKDLEQSQRLHRLSGPPILLD
jgi:hypothetical protein